MIHVIPDHFLTSPIAVCGDLFGRKPCDVSKKMDSYLASNIILKACCIILSLGLGIPNGLVFPLAFGICTLLTGLNLKLRFFKFSTVLIIHSFDIPSSVMLSDPGLMLPGFDFINS